MIARTTIDACYEVKLTDAVQKLGTQLKKHGAQHIGCCPFHDDHNPSFWVDAKRNLWGCFACGYKGDVINLHARKENRTLQAAIRDLSGRLSHVHS